MSTYHEDKPRKPWGDWVVEMLVRVVLIAAFLLVVTPHFIAPWLGVTQQDYQNNTVYWTILSIIAGYLFAWPMNKLVLRSIRSVSK